MKIKDKIIVVTGAGSGIGRAMVEAFVAQGAKQVVAVDINTQNAQQTASQNGCIAMSADVANEADIKRVIEDTESNVGPIDLFCSNAGLGTGQSEQSPDSEWLISWHVNVMAHVLAARHLIPRMIARGGGYLLNTASAAGLLNQIGGAAYGVTKHAAIGFGEWIALTYAHQGIKVSMLCPQAVRTAMMDNPGEGMDSTSIKAAATDGIIEVEQVAQSVIEGLDRESFLILPHPQVETYIKHKADDYDRWISGMNRLHRLLTGD
jgi:NAD(P)-dependent dehydrogenase (short-subunit alcohol dehydrogenase family)